MDYAYIGKIIIRLLPYTLITIKIVIISFLAGCFFGGLLAWGKLCKVKVINKIAFGYTTMIRCTPFIIMLFIVFYGIPYLLLPFGIDANVIGKEVFTIITLTMYTSSNLSDNFRASYVAINKGQTEAALCVGMKKTQALRRIVFPQMIFIALPMMSNVIVSEFQDTALAFAIGLVDLMGQAKVMDALSYNVNTFEIYVAVSLLFWGLAILCEQTIKYIHTSLDFSKKKRHSLKKA